MAAVKAVADWMAERGVTLAGLVDVPSTKFWQRRSGK
jgi:hypothetical protein